MLGFWGGGGFAVVDLAADGAGRRVAAAVMWAGGEEAPGREGNEREGERRRTGGGGEPARVHHGSWPFYTLCD